MWDLKIDLFVYVVSLSKNNREILTPIYVYTNQTLNSSVNRKRDNSKMLTPRKKTLLCTNTSVTFWFDQVHTNSTKIIAVQRYIMIIHLKQNKNSKKRVRKLNPALCLIASFYSDSKSHLVCHLTKSTLFNFFFFQYNSDKK